MEYQEVKEETKSEAFAVFTRSQAPNQPNQQSSDKSKVNDAPQLLDTLEKKGTPLPLLPKDPIASKPVSTLDPFSSNMSKIFPISSKLVNDVPALSLDLQYQYFDIIDYA